MQVDTQTKEVLDLVNQGDDRQRLTRYLLVVMPFLVKRMMRSIPDSGMPRLQFHLLHAISHFGPKPMSDFSERMGIPKPNLSVLADKLVEDGFACRERDEADKRVMNLRITDKGELRLEEILKKDSEYMAEKLAVFSDDEVARLVSLFSEISQAFSKAYQ
jgi:DNA-binding MarR family transcriptional regulator